MTITPADHPEDRGARSARIPDLLAGRLSEVEAAELRAAMDEDPELRAEQDFWAAYRVGMTAHGRPAAREPGPAFAEVVRRRLAEAPASLEPMPGPGNGQAHWWRRGALAAAAALVFALGALFSSGDVSTDANTAYAEDGSLVVLPPGERYAMQPASYQVEPDTDATLDYQAPWLGLLATRPVTFSSGPYERGLRIMQIAEPSPAATAGMQPGDVLVALSDCSLFSRSCIRHALQDIEADRIKLTWYSQDDGDVRSQTVPLGQVHDLRQRGK